MAARWSWAFSASLSLKCFTRAIRSLERCLSRGAALMFGSGCYKNLPGAGVEGWTGGVRWEVRAQSGLKSGGPSRS